MPAVVQNIKQIQKQQQVLVPQMMRYMKLLSLPVQDIGQYLRRAVTENPLLELKYPLEECVDFMGAEDRAPDYPGTAEDFTLFSVEDTVADFSGSGNSATASSGAEFEDFFVPSEDPNSTLKASLRLQLFAGKLSPLMEHIGLCIIERLDTAGYFTDDTGEFAKFFGVREAVVVQVLDLIKTFEPCGIGAKNLAESLSLQYSDDRPYSVLVRKMLARDADNMSLRKLKFLAKKYNLSLKKVQAIFAELRRLDPRPGTHEGGKNESIPYVYPDIVVTTSRSSRSIQIAGCPGDLFGIDSGYEAMMHSLSDEATRHYLRAKYREAKGVVAMLGMRQRTLLRLTKFICTVQKDYFIYGERVMRPCTVAQAAKALGYHTSTVLRCLNGKYVRTRWGMFPLWHFFSPPVTSDSLIYTKGNSVQSVKEMIRSIIDSEKSGSLSDREIASILESSGIYISRRTVAKYRSSLHIDSSHMRKECPGGVS
jgi:RNA polymerase sigma-54 factor